LKLSKLPRYASDIAIDLGISKPAVKKHLEKLKDAGIILKHESDDSDDKKQYYCLNSELSVSFSLDLNPNYFSYRSENTNLIISSIFGKSSESSNRYVLQASVLGDKSGITRESTILRRSGKIKAANESLTQLGRALRDIELDIRELEDTRHKFLANKNEIITRIKHVINSLVSEPMEREIIFSFFYRTIESFNKGLSIQKFLEDIFLKFSGSRAGVRGDTTQSIGKQRKRIEKLEILLNNIINEFNFIKKIRDINNEQIIVFDF
jgi:predicted transcriptional regulator